MSDPVPAERRLEPRFPTDDLVVGVRVKGRLARLEGVAIDFNRHGLALVLDQPIRKDATVYIDLNNGDTHLDHVVGVVHNCTSLEFGYRAGVQFRTQCALQHDQASIEQTLTILESRFKARLELAIDRQ